MERSLLSSATASFKPILHRSHLFAPISKESPVFLCDLLIDTLGVTKICVTLYDVTFRLDHESKWMELMHTLLEEKDAVGASTVSQEPRQEEKKDLIVRLFFSLADCNIDYQSPRRFSTPARLITRLGDIRLSSNLVFPKPSVQAISLSFGDVSVYLCSQRFGYCVS